MVRLCKLDKNHITRNVTYFIAFCLLFFVFSCCEEGIHSITDQTSLRSISISPSKKELVVGESFQLSVLFKPSDYQGVSYIVWNSSNSDIVSITQTGLVRAIAVGNVTVTAYCEGFSSSCKITVSKKNVPVESITMVLDTVYLTIGDARSLYAIVSPDFATDKSINWKSSNPGIATVDNSGKVYARAVGLTTITAQSGNFSTTCKLYVEKSYESSYFTIRALEDCSLNWNVHRAWTFYCSLNGKNWEQWRKDLGAPQAINSLKKGDEIRFKRDDDDPWTAGFDIIKCTGLFEVEGNVMSLFYGDDFIGQNEYHMYGGPLSQLFYESKTLVSARNLVLPSTVNVDCYFRTFYNCSSLKYAPKLPAKTLVAYCYAYMFDGCISLKEAPELLAVNLAPSCYERMFSGCKNLKYVKCTYPAQINIHDYVLGWCGGVSNRGYFIKSSENIWWTVGENGIPEGWSIINEN